MSIMGCDIILYLEYKNPITWNWEPFGYGYNIPRNYIMFAKMAGVRDEGNNTVFNAKGLPEDISEYIKAEFDKYLGYYHDPSWLSKDDFQICIESYKEDSQIDILEYKALFAAMNVFEKYRCESRIIFWFEL